MMENRFEAHKMEIKAISEARSVDIGTACSMWAHENAQADYGAELTAFTRHIARLDAEGVRTYFEG